MEPLRLGEKLSLDDVLSVAAGKRRVELSSEATGRIEKSFQFLNDESEQQKVMYGVNTGFGLFSGIRIEPEDIKKLQVNYLRSHSTGVGAYLSDTDVRAMLLLRANSLAIGNSGVSLGLVKQLINLLNHGVCPLIPEQGSVGASGDLAPLAHLAAVLIGEGKARVEGKEMIGAEALKKVRLEPIELQRKEALALTNGTQFMTALGVFNLNEAEKLADVADFAGALSLEAMRGSTAAFEDELHEARPHPGQKLTAKRLIKILRPNGKMTEVAESHRDCDKVQDPYSLRCIPQVHGASRDAIAFVRSTLECEVNSVTDNPLVFPDTKKVLSGGNFHGQYISMGMDLLAIAVAEYASISEQRFQKLIKPQFSGLPALLAPKAGLDSGFMIVQVAAASIVSENKTLCHPASVDSIPTNGDKEDHVSMGPWAARKARMVITNTWRVLAMELLAACQGLDQLRPMKTSPALEKIYDVIRRKVPKIEEDRSFSDDLRYTEDLIKSDSFQALLRLNSTA